MDLHDLLQITGVNLLLKVPFAVYLIIFAVILFYKYMTWNFDYWKIRGVPGKKPWIIMGTFKPTWIYPFECQDMESFKKYGKTFGGFEGTQRVLYTVDPDIIRQVTVKDFSVFPNRKKFTRARQIKYVKDMLSVVVDDKWKILRNTLTPTFTTGKLKQMTNLIEECVDELNQSMETEVEKGESLQMTDKFIYLTLNIIASTAFGIHLDCVNNPKSELITKSRAVLRPFPILAYFTFILPDLFEFLPSFKVDPFKYFADVANEVIDLRLQNKTLARKDFLEIILNAEVIHSEENNSEIQNNSRSSATSKKTLTRDSIIAQTIMFLLAGFETTAATLSVLSYELAMNPNIQDKLISEIDEAMSECKGKISYEVIASMQYLDMVVLEILRLNPPATRIDRVCEQNNYPINDITIDKGVIVAIPIYVLHHNPEFYPNPEVFDPDRFLPENKQKRNSFTYIPFGSGPRNCIAMRFALMEIKIVIVLMLCKYRFETCEKTQIPLKFVGAGVGLRSPQPIFLKLQKRTDNLHFND